MDMITVTAKTLDEAITKALIELGTTSDNLDYDVVEKGSAGFLGLFGGKNVVIKAKKKREDDDLEAFLTTGKVDSTLSEPIKESKEKKEPVKESIKEPAKEPEKENSKKKNQKNQQKNQKKAKKEEAASEIKEEAKQAVRQPEKPVSPENVKNEWEEDTQEKKPAKKIDVDTCTTAAKGFLDQVFAAMGMEVTITSSFDEKERELTLDMAGADMGILIGKRGQTLDSLQYLTSLVVNKECDGYVRVKLDTENYRARRKETLETLAKNIAYKVKRTRRNVSLEPMNPYERRIIHAALQNDRYVVTRSEGEDPFRHVVISLKREGKERREGRKNNQGQNQE